MLRRATAEALDSIGDMGLSSEQEVLARLDLFWRYRGPVVVETDVPDIPGAIYSQPDETVGRIGGTVLSMGHHGKELAVEVTQPEGESAKLLLPHQIRSVELGHPRRQDLPLFGRGVPAFSRVTLANGDARFVQSSDTSSHAPRCRLETGTHSRYPGIGVVKAYPAFDPEAPNDDPHELPSLEEIKRIGLKATAIFYMSEVVTRGYVVTSRTDNEDNRQITVPRCWESEGPVDVDMTDMAASTSDGELLTQHMQQFRWLRGERAAQPNDWRSPFITDALFLRILES